MMSVPWSNAISRYLPRRPVLRIVRPQALRQVGRERPAQAAMAQRHCGDNATIQMRRDAAPRDFNFRQFRHSGRAVLAEKSWFNQWS
jgi:hypothetical protein